MIRSTCAQVLLILGVVCVNSFVGSIWIASFQDLFQQAYAHRTSGLLFCGLTCFGVSGLLLAGGAWEWISRRSGTGRPRS